MDKRAEAVAIMERTVSDQAAYHNWTYQAVRPQEIPSSYHGQHVVVDCSDGCRAICRWANIPDPAGNDFAPYGNSTSIWLHCDTIALKDAAPGDIATFGKWQGEDHACMFWEKYGPNDHDWYVWNMGAQGQPAKRTLSAEIAGHPGTTMTVKRIEAPVLPPSQEHVLRAKKGYYAWVAWRLGEGPWKKYGPAAKKVRPNVPRVIPAAWWARLVRFLANRKKGNPATSKP